MNDKFNTGLDEAYCRAIFFGVLLFVFGITCVSHEGFARQAFYLFIALPALVFFLRKLFFERNRMFSRPLERNFLLLFLFLTYCFSSVFWGPLDILGRADVIERFYYLLFFSLAVFLLSSEPDLLRKIPYIFVLLTSLSLCLAVVQWDQDVNRLRGVGRIEIATHAAGFYCIASVLSAYFSYQSEKTLPLIAWNALSLFLLIGTVLTVSRAMMLINLLFLLALAFLYFRKNWWNILLSAVAVGLVLSLTLGLFFPEKLAVLQQKGLDSARYKIWASGLELFLQNPLFGVGLGLNETIMVDFGGFKRAYHAHNLFLDFAVRLGLAGVIGLVTLLVIAIRQGVRNPEYHPWLLMLIVYLLFSLVSGRVVLDRIQPDWVTFYLPLFVLLAAPKPKELFYPEGRKPGDRELAPT